jgi:hypothetical protein
MEKGKVFDVDKLTYGRDFYVLPPNIFVFLKESSVILKKVNLTDVSDCDKIKWGKCTEKVKMSVSNGLLKIEFIK